MFGHIFENFACKLATYSFEAIIGFQFSGHFFKILLKCRCFGVEYKLGSFFLQYFHLLFSSYDIYDGNSFGNKQPIQHPPERTGSSCMNYCLVFSRFCLIQHSQSCQWVYKAHRTLLDGNFLLQYRFTFGRVMHVVASTIAYWPQVPESPFDMETATFFPTIDHAISPPPLSITTPAPSNPGVVGSFLTDWYPPPIKAKSEGLIGAARILTKSSPGPGLGMGTSLTQNSLVPVRMTAFIIFSCETFGLRSPLVSSIANLRNLYERYLSARLCVILQKTNIIMQHQAKNVSKSQVIDHKKDHHADPQFRSQVVPPPPIVQASQKSKSDDILSQQLRERLAYVRKCVLSELDEFGQRLSNLLSNYNLIKFASKTGQDIQGYIDGSESQQTLITKMKQAGLSEHGFIEAIQNCKEQLQASRHQKSFINFQLICPTGLTLIRRYDDLINKYFPIININGSKQPQEESRPSVFQLKSTKFSEEEYRGIESLLQSANRKLKSVTLIFRASEHQFRSKAFKEECSKMEKTMVVVKSVKGRVFGGYTPCKWLDTKETEYIADTHRQSFLFSLDQKLVFPVRQNQTDYAISTYGSWGPIFGSPYGPDLSLADQCHLNEHSCSSLGSHYEIPITVKQFSNEAFCLLAGSKKFKVVQYQVFQVQFE